mmetsp:Transcript_11700/g.20517  ORF Transcript_11700/g.20517 Transcript_11700/m.20517 type:complete len:255 (+) Transcript_11700:309-1073(+)
MHHYRFARCNAWGIPFFPRGQHVSLGYVGNLGSAPLTAVEIISHLLDLARVDLVLIEHRVGLLDDAGGERLGIRRDVFLAHLHDLFAERDHPLVHASLNLGGGCVGALAHQREACNAVKSGSVATDEVPELLLGSEGLENGRVHQTRDHIQRSVLLRRHTLLVNIATARYPRLDAGLQVHGHGAVLIGRVAHNPLHDESVGFGLGGQLDGARAASGGLGRPLARVGEELTQLVSDRCGLGGSHLPRHRCATARE